MADITNAYTTSDGRPLGTPHISDLEIGYSRERYSFILKHDPSIFQNKTILDVGGGYGAGALQLVDYNAAHIDCVDLNPIAIKTGKTYFSDEKINYILGTWNDLKGPYDIVVAVELVEHLTTDELNQSLKQWNNILTDKGHLYITTPKRRMPKECYPEGSHFTEYDLEELVNMVEPFGFKLVWHEWPENTDGISLALLFDKV